MKKSLGLSATEAKKLSFSVYDDPAVLSEELKNFSTQYPAGQFSLSGKDSAHFTIDQSGTVKLIENADFERKAAYDFAVEYKEGTVGFTDSVSLMITDNDTDNGLKYHPGKPGETIAAEFPRVENVLKFKLRYPAYKSWIAMKKKNFINKKKLIL